MHVSVMGKAYQKQQHLLQQQNQQALSSSGDEAVQKYCNVSAKVCRHLEEALE